MTRKPIKCIYFLLVTKRCVFFADHNRVADMLRQAEHTHPFHVEQIEAIHQTTTNR